jgi:cytochrome c biogenesis protein CcmG/thiol:disulfide interchange protein DsbE
MNTPVPETPRRSLPIAAIVIGLVFLSLMGLLLYGVSQSGRADRDALPSPLIGKPAPAFALPVLHEPERTVTLEELKGQPFLLNVWGSWCVECRVEHPVLTRFAETRSLRVVGYNWKDEPADALRWLEQFGNPYWLVLADVEGRAAIDWGIYGAPETFLVDGAGMIRWKHIGALTDEVIEGELMPALRAIEARQ